MRPVLDVPNSNLNLKVPADASTTLDLAHIAEQVLIDFDGDNLIFEGWGNIWYQIPTGPYSSTSADYSGPAFLPSADGKAIFTFSDDISSRIQVPSRLYTQK